MQTRCHLSVLIHEQAKKYGDREVLFFQSFGSTKWKSVSWNQFSLRVKQVSNALLNLGLKPQEKIAVFSQNCIQYLYTDFGAYGVRAVSIPFYATSSEQQIQYMLRFAFSLWANKSSMTKLTAFVGYAIRWNALFILIIAYVSARTTLRPFRLKIS